MQILIFFTGNSKLNVAPTTTAKSHHKHLSASMQSLRNTVNRISHPHISSSRTSLNSEKNRKNIISTSSTIDVEDKISSKVKDEPSISSMYHSFIYIRRGLVVRISAFHAGGPGSIPGVGMLFFLLYFFLFTLTYSIRSFAFLKYVFYA